MQASLILMANRSAAPGLCPAGGAVLSPEGALVTATLVLIFGSSSPTRGADSASAGISWTAVSLVLTWGGSGAACGAGETSGRESSCKADFLVLIRLCFIRSPGNGPALAPPSLAETASLVLIRGRSCGDGSWDGGCSPGASGDGESAGISCVGRSAVVRGSPSSFRLWVDFFFFSRASTPRRA